MAVVGPAPQAQGGCAVTGARAMWQVVALAAVSVAGIVGMLLAEGGWDGLFFAMTALPLAAGLWFRHRAGRAPRG
ncbi:hypothetical protein STPYR_11618 [uncultured Stenotrophomonas sp.]|uniref:Transmembrane protein n=1 Tax=uncultured Stenotrophomonas sp. TaxID=165438 RepID=A0A1Y5Q341_9GAMM|nr:hypothetical protein STPYR_11618 [uncultured Stenotrophomonas sp.]